MDIGSINKFYFYAYTGKTCGSIALKYTLTENIHPEKLFSAVNLCLSRFAYMRLSPVVSDDGEIRFETNTKPSNVRLYDGGKLRLGTEDTDGYMFSVRYSGKNIYLNAFHGFGDVRAIHLFGMTVVYNYLLLLGKDVDTENIIPDIASPIDESELDTLYEKCLSYKENIKPQLYNKKNVFVIPTQNVLVGTEFCHVYRIKWRTDEFVKLVHELGATPTSFLSTAIAEAIHASYDLGDRIVTASVPVDMRSMLSSSAQSNFTCNVNLPTFNTDYALDFTERALLQKDFLKSQVTKDNLIHCVLNYGRFTESMMNFSLADKQKIERFQKLAIDASKDGKTYLLTNVGKFQMPASMRAYIADIQVTLPVMEDSPLACVTSYGNNSYINWSQNNDDDTLIHAINNVLNSVGLKTELMDDGRVESDECQPYWYVQ